MKVALGGIFEISSGGTPSKTHAEYYDGNIPWVKTGDLKSEYLNSVDEYITDEGLKNSSAKMYEPGTVLLAMYGATIGAASILTFNACTNQACAAFKPCKDVIPEYLYYFLLSRREKFIHDGVGGAQPNISGRYLKQVEFELYPINEQRFVISVLDRVNRIISLKKEEIKKLDELIKARFVEMFGDPEMNPYGWQKINISNIVQGKVSNGYFAKRDEYVEDGNAAILGVAYIVNRIYSGIEGLPRTNVTLADIQKYKVRYGDMLFCRSSLVAEGIGKASIVPENVPDNTLFECHVIRLPLDMDKCVPEFMQVLSTTDYFRKQMIAQSKTATMTTIGQDGIKKANIILPPIEKQREFYSFVKQIDKSKVVVPSKIKNTIFAIMLSVSFGQITSI